MSKTLIRAAIVHFPQQTPSPSQHYQYFSDGALVIDGTSIVACGDYEATQPLHHDAVVQDQRGKLLIPGLIDSHVHFPQTEMIASYGEQLLEWLENYTFPVERKFADDDYAGHIAQVFLRQLLRNGTTTAMVFASVHKGATEALFRAAAAKEMRLIAGKVCMDRHCPDWLQDTPGQAQQHSAELIERWHGKGRLSYCLTPRFAPTSSEAQLKGLGELAQQYPDVFIQTHLSENRDEIAWVKSLFPQFNHYLDVYDHYGLVRPRAVMGHGIHLHDDEWQCLKTSGATIAFCPTSNLFLGSGLFDLQRARELGVHVALATDVGAGTSFNMLRTMGEAYKVCQLQGTKLDPMLGLYLMTQGAAVALRMEQYIGNLNAGSEADFVLLDPAFDELSELRLADSDSPEDVLFALSMLGDDRSIAQTWVNGQLVYQK